MFSNPKQLATTFKALSDPNRLKIIRCLARSEKCVCHIFECLKLPQSLTSHHLAVLKKAGLIQSRRTGKFIHYSLNTKKLAELNKALKELNTSGL
jgi:ArsR family transcriptional regulator